MLKALPLQQLGGKLWDQLPTLGGPIPYAAPLANHGGADGGVGCREMGIGFRPRPLTKRGYGVECNAVLVQTVIELGRIRQPASPHQPSEALVVRVR